MNEKAVEALAQRLCVERTGLSLEDVHKGFARFYRSKALEYLEVAEQACKEEENVTLPVAKFRAAESMADVLRNCNVEYGCCMCGSREPEHANHTEGHGYVDMGAYQAQQALDAWEGKNTREEEE